MIKKSNNLKVSGNK